VSPCFSSDCLLFWSNWCHHVSPLFVFCVVLCFCALFGFVSCLVIVYLMLSVSLDCPFFIAPSCCQCLCIVHSLLPLRVVSVSVLSILYCPFVLPMSLDCPFFIAHIDFFLTFISYLYMITHNLFMHKDFLQYWCTYLSAHAILTGSHRQAYTIVYTKSPHVYKDMNAKIDHT